jgi:hypothetical protein
LHGDARFPANRIDQIGAQDDGSSSSAPACRPRNARRRQPAHGHFAVLGC